MEKGWIFIRIDESKRIGKSVISTPVVSALTVTVVTRIQSTVGRLGQQFNPPEARRQIKRKTSSTLNDPSLPAAAWEKKSNAGVKTHEHDKENNEKYPTYRRCATSILKPYLCVSVCGLGAQVLPDDH